MEIQLPVDLPLWGGWILFGVTGIMWLATSVGRVRSDSAQREKTKTEVLQMKLGMLQSRAADYGDQLKTIADVLQADAENAPSPAQIELVSQIGKEGNAVYASMASHLQARARARKELPRVLARVARVQALQSDLSRSAAVGLKEQSSELAEVGAELEAVGGEVSNLIKEIAESPRVLVGSVPPDDAGDDGDIFLQIPEDGRR
ncbi:hypothetical protein [Microbacterium phyllosphaerae]